jgi:hypothetical protein
VGIAGSRPDHVLVFSRIVGLADSVCITEDRVISDHCPLSMTFRVPAAGLDCVDWQMNNVHVCKPGWCGSRFTMKWRPECAEVYAEELAENRELQDHFNQAIDRCDHEAACFCSRSMIMQAAGDYRVGMAGPVSVCGPLRARRRGAHRPPWFDSVCREKRQAFNVLRASQPLHAREVLHAV